MPDIIRQIRDTYAENSAAALKRMPELFKAVGDGKIIELPCKVGDTVYVIAKCESVHVDRDDDYFTGTGAMKCPFEDSCNFENCSDENERIFETTVSSFWIENDKWIGVLLDNLSAECYVSDFGKTVFLTREAAKAALKKGEKNYGV